MDLIIYSTLLLLLYSFKILNLNYLEIFSISFQSEKKIILIIKNTTYILYSTTIQIIIKLLNYKLIINMVKLT